MPSPRDRDPIHQPLPRTEVARPGLLGRLDRVTPGGLGLVVAPAGSGKSVLLRQWSADRPELRMAALGLEPRHNDAVALARDLLGMVRSAAPELHSRVDELVMAGGSTLGGPFTEGFLSALEELSGDLVLVLEDVHVLTNRGLLEDVGELVTGLPAAVRVVTTTRRDPPWSLHRLRLNGGLVEIRGADLAFTPAEARQLLTAVSERELTDDQVRALTERTDGWVVGLQLAAISLQNVADVSTAIDSFAGSDRLIAEYLMEEVIAQQPPDVRRFLLQTSVLRWLSAEVCDAVTGTANARAMLEGLEERSLFLIRLDRSGELFRYHHVFADLLRYQLRLEDPRAADGLHVGAARWLLDHGRPEEAIEHLLSAREHRMAFAVIAQEGHRLFERGESATLVRWLSTIQEENAEASARVGINLLAAQVAADLAEGAHETHRRLSRRSGLTLGERTAADTLFSLLVYRDVRPELVLKTTDRVLEAIPLLEEEDVVDFLGLGGLDSMEVMATYAAAVAHLLQGDMGQARATLEHALDLPGEAYPLWRIYTLGTLSLVRAWAGECTAALGLAEAAIGAARSAGVASHSGVTHAHMASALVHMDRAELDAASRALAESDLQNRRRVSGVVYFDFQRALEARLAAVVQGPAHALAILREPASSAFEPAVLVASNRALVARLLIATGDLVQARATLEGSDRSPELVAARVDLALATDDHRAAREILDSWEPSAGDLRAVVGRLLRSAMLLQAEGDHGGAGAALREAVARAEGERLRWPFIEVPGALRQLRRRAAPGTPFTDDALFRTARSLQPRRHTQEGVVEPLTGRELAVLEYLPRRIKNDDIADDLFISVNTLKSHLRSIYRKLGVTDRDAAVTRAGELGLL